MDIIIEYISNKHNDTNKMMSQLIDNIKVKNMLLLTVLKELS